MKCTGIINLGKREREIERPHTKPQKPTIWELTERHTGGGDPNPAKGQNCPHSSASQNQRQGGNDNTKHQSAKTDGHARTHPRRHEARGEAAEAGEARGRQRNASQETHKARWQRAEARAGRGREGEAGNGRGGAL